MRTLSHAAAVGATLALFGSAFATDTWARGGGGSPSRTCAVDLKAMCGDVKPGGGRVKACFESHISELSSPCTDKLSRAAYLAKECQADIRKLCGGVKRAADIQGCMKGRMAEVDKQCKNALSYLTIPNARNR